MVLISVAGVLSTPLLMLIEALQTHFDKPEIIFTLSDIYSDSVLYIMLLVNIMIYVAIAAYLFSREYTESTLKTILPIPISRTKLLIGKFCTLLLWIVMLTLVTWAGIFIVCGLYDAVFTLEGYSLLVAIVWLPKFLFGSILMFLTVSPSKRPERRRAYGDYPASAFSRGIYDISRCLRNFIMLRVHMVFLYLINLHRSESSEANMQCNADYINTFFFNLFKQLLRKMQSGCRCRC